MSWGYIILLGINNYAYSGRLLKSSLSSSSPRGSKFSISSASILNGENMRFRPAVFNRLILAPVCSKWHQKNYHSIAETLLFMNMQKLR